MNPVIIFLLVLALELLIITCIHALFGTEAAKTAFWVIDALIIGIWLVVKGLEVLGVMLDRVSDDRRLKQMGTQEEPKDLEFKSVTNTAASAITSCHCGQVRKDHKENVFVVKFPLGTTFEDGNPTLPNETLLLIEDGTLRNWDE
jgi:hypothetical protein